MATLHTKASRHVEKADHIHAMRASGKLKDMRGELSETAQHFEYFLYGLLEGMAFKEKATCYGGLVNVIYQAFEILQYKDVYNPTKTLKFTIATQKFSEASNIVYA